MALLRRSTLPQTPKIWAAAIGAVLLRLCNNLKAYYSMFHSAKAVLFALGLKERSHFAVAEVLEIVGKAGKLEMRFVTYFRAAMSARESADYHYTHDRTTAEDIIRLAEEFVGRMEQLALEMSTTGVQKN